MERVEEQYVRLQLVIALSRPRNGDGGGRGRPLGVRRDTDRKNDEFPAAVNAATEKLYLTNAYSAGV